MPNTSRVMPTRIGSVTDGKTKAKATVAPKLPHVPEAGRRRPNPNSETMRKGSEVIGESVNLERSGT